VVSQRSSEAGTAEEGFDLSGIDLSVDRDYDLPLGVQLAWKLRALIASGRIAPGDRLPSVRELAERAGVNVNTVRSVYGRLESDGFLVARHGLGTFAADPSPTTASIENLAAAAVADARAEGLDPRDLATAIYAAAAPDSALPEDSPPAPDRSGTDWDDDDEPPPGSGAAVPDLDQESDQPGARRELRRQIAKLEGTLAAYAEGSRIGTLRPASRPGPHLPDVGELERTRNFLVDILAELGAAAEHQAAQRERARLEREAIVRDPAAHRWARIDNDQLGEPGCRNWHAVPRFSLLGLLMGWWRVKVSAGCPLAGPREAASDDQGERS
jgi:DNA-binding transcriptional regulator YhcF (GntR family)